jgi:hypothetical protein
VTLSVDSSRVRAAEFVPHDRVGRIALRPVLGPVGPGRQHGVDDVERDRPSLFDPERLEPVDDFVGDSLAISAVISSPRGSSTAPP